MTLSVVIPTHKRPFQAACLIESLRKQDFLREKLQILLVSNLREKQLEKMAEEWREQFYDFKYLVSGKIGVNKARNLGIRFAGGDIIYFLDDDCALPGKDHLKKLVKEHELRPEAAGIGGGYRSPHELHGLEKFYYGLAEEWTQKSSSGRESAFQLAGGNSSYKREVFDRGFNFDSQISFGGSEEGFNSALISRGRKLFFSDEFSVYHFVKISFLQLIKKSFLQGKGSFLNRYRSGQALSLLENMKKEWAFVWRRGSFYSFFYSFFFKMGYFWALSHKKGRPRLFFRLFYFLILIVKSRLFFLRESVISRVLGGVWLMLGGVWLMLGSVWLMLGRVWFMLGWLWGNVVGRVLGRVWFVLGWLWGAKLIPAFYHSPPMKIYYFIRHLMWGKVIGRSLGWVWFALGWVWFALGWVWFALGWVWFALGWVWGKVIGRSLGWVWFALGWVWGKVIGRSLGWVWFALGWVWGKVIGRSLGWVWFALGWVWFALGWVWGKVIGRSLGWVWFALGWVWFALGWVWGKVIMKVYHFSHYQYSNKRIKLNLMKMIGAEEEDK